MNILAVYDHDQLQLPGKVLTHSEDIEPLLAGMGVRLERLQPLPALGQDDSDQTIAAAFEPILADSQTAGLLHCLRVQRMEALPGYADEAPHADEQCFEQATARLQVRGAGVVCLHQDRQLLVLSCRQGDLLTLPARLAHWFVPSAGQASLVIHAAATQQALIAELTGNDIASRYQVLEL